ncbi:hypothetical protein [Paenibacillus sacheonensis]|uniref:hypothetical protein n=1 Tax=Paenibacillus sacheonensis TaxID=742054 RepID=UPI00195D3969|nr:hypothetical protein [Paenibacillus sacheonensis]MBM7567763.1 hypothetical protein [Paenibacillus sacheonensis]
MDLTAEQLLDPARQVQAERALPQIMRSRKIDVAQNAPIGWLTIVRIAIRLKMPLLVG